MKKKITLSMLYVVVALTTTLKAQPFTVFSSGFSNLIGISRDAHGDLFVAESGSGFNDSKISLITPTATVYPVVIDLPSFLDTASGEVSGAWRAEMINSNVLMVMVGGGVDTNAGSLLFFDMTSFIPGTSSPFTVANADSIIRISSWVYSQGFMDSDPYSSAFDTNGDIFIADAGANAIIKYEAATRTLSVLDTFPAFPNPFGGLPPMIDFVPTRIISNPAGGFYMCNLGGFFPTLGRVLTISSSGIVQVEDSGLTALVDMQYDAITSNKYVLVFGGFDSLFNPLPGSAKIFRIDPAGNIALVDTGFGPSAGFVLDGNGGAYVTEIGTGNVLYISDLTGVNHLTAKTGFSLSASPNPFTTLSDITISQNESNKADIFVKNITGETVYSAPLQLTNGENHFYWDGRSAKGINLPGGNYFITVKTPENSVTIKIIKQ
jgi:hypothetical protein